MAEGGCVTERRVCDREMGGGGRVCDREKGVRQRDGWRREGV